MAHTLAADPAIVSAAAVEDPGLALPARGEAARAATGALFVVITDRHGIRLAHPTRERIHEPVSTDPSAVLAGRYTINVERGTLGLSAPPLALAGRRLADAAGAPSRCVRPAVGRIGMTGSVLW